MYESSFDTEWQSLTREEGMFRAFALGVDASMGYEHPTEIERLMRETSRPLVQLAYDEGKSLGNEKLQSADLDLENEAFRPTPAEWDLWKDVIEERRNDPSSFELVTVSRGRLDLPGAISRPELLKRATHDTDAIRLPRFLFQ